MVPTFSLFEFVSAVLSFGFCLWLRLRSTRHRRIRHQPVRYHYVFVFSTDSCQLVAN